MAGFARERRGLVLYLEVPEAELLASTTEQFIALLDDGRHAEPAAPEGVGSEVAGAGTAADDPAGAEPDPFAQWEREFGHDATQQPDNPVLARLFPSPYPDDPEASDEFHRFTEPAQRAAKIQAASTVLDDLQQLNNGMVPVPQDHRDAWLKTLNNIRLTLSVVLDITDETSHDLAGRHRPDDPRSWMYQVYGWLAWLLESLLDTMMGGTGDPA